MSDAPRRPRVAEIQQAVADEFRVPMIEMISNRRARRVARPRQIAMYLARTLTPLSLPDIGRRFGGRDHTTVMHACRHVPMLMVDDPALYEAVARIVAVLREDQSQPRLPMG